ncbi:hypothetical protein CDAR_603441 [Caerostris darwini]|uniref:Uncharacterized protein n=1 Tax=Caerostris darwini TaxID=1538125 RepID=A0AAV4T6L4_9ARAC|nr:hypothetical protein CDAR_603441 [Caerostris darwini]
MSLAIHENNVHHLEEECCSMNEKKVRSQRKTNAQRRRLVLYFFCVGGGRDSNLGILADSILEGREEKSLLRGFVPALCIIARFKDISLSLSHSFARERVGVFFCRAPKCSVYLSVSCLERYPTII